MKVVVISSTGVRYKGKLYKKGEEFIFLNEEEAQKLISLKYLKKNEELEKNEEESDDFETPEIEETKIKEEEMSKWDEITLNYYEQYSVEEKEEFWKKNKKERGKIKKQAHDAQEE